MEDWRTGELTLKQGRAVEDTSGQVTRVDASEAVWRQVSRSTRHRSMLDEVQEKTRELTCLSCVASDTDNARVSCIVGTKVHEYLGDSVLAS